MVGSLADEQAGLVRLQAAAVLAVVLGAHLSLAPAVASVDAFYHLGHAAQYRQGGIFDTSFPWGTASIIGDLGGDLWWGFHVLLVPFTLFAGVTDGIRVAAFLFTLIFAAAAWWVLRRHAVPGAGWWTALLLVAVPNVLYRFLMVRPHVLSLALALLLLSFLVRGRWWHLLLFSAAMTWLHVSLFWMAPGVVGAYVLARSIGGRIEDDPGVPVVPAVAAVAAGTVLGGLLRPHPMATAELAYVQIVRLFAEKGTDRPLLFATELLPLGVGDLLRSSGSFLLLLFAALVGAWVWRKGEARGAGGDPLPPPERRLLLAAALIAGVFLALTLLSARRALVEMVVFGFLVLPLVWAFILPAGVRRRSVIPLVLLLVAHLGWAGQRHLLNARLVAFPPDAMAEVGAWLTRNAAPGDVVFHAHWDDFGPLFARNRQVRYLGGMDPIFQYAHDPGRYWEHFFLSGDLVVEYTCDAFPCYEGTATETWAAIRDHFHARWVVLEPARNPKLTAYLLQSPGFSLVLETRREAVFRVLDAPVVTDLVPGDGGAG